MTVGVTLSSFISLATAAACSTVPASLPAPTLRPGQANPFYPCGATKASVDACPYRCYSAVERTNFTDVTLLDACFTESQASALVASLTHICVRCVVPPASEIPNSLTKGPTCQPLADYFNTTYPTIPPAKCGTRAHPLPECAWICGAAQVPFSLCDTRNTSSTYRSCVKCLPQCSSPVIVFDPPSIPSNFSLSTGTCHKPYGAREDEACPYRCTDPSSGGNSFCSLRNLNDTGPGFQTCQKCT